MRDDWSTLRKLMFQRMAAGGRLIEDTVTGNPAVFETNVAKPLTGFTIPFLPVQTGSGDPSPQNPRPIIGWQGLTAWRTGVNVWDEEVELGGINSSTGKPYTSTSALRSKNYIPVVPGASYYMTSPTSSCTGCWYDKDKNYISTRYVTNREMTAPDNAYFFRFDLPSSYGTTYNHDISINYPSTETEYAPYTGQSYPVIFPAQGKNLLNIERTEKVVPGATGSTITIADGVISIDAIAGSARTYVVLEQELPPGTYTIHGKASGACSGLRLLSSAEIAGSSYNSYYGMYIKGLVDGVMTFTLPSSAKIGLNLLNATGQAGEPGTAYDIQLEAGSTATAYEPFTNTVYGGTAYPLEGRALVEWKYVLLNDADSWTDGQTFMSYPETGKLDRKKGSSYGFYCSCFPSEQKSSGVAYIRWGGTEASNVLIAKNDSGLTIEVVKQMASDGDIAICYELATPIEITLDPITIQTLIGDNTIWTDTNGENTVRYKKKG